MKTALENGRRPQGPLSRQTQCRSTPIATNWTVVLYGVPRYQECGKDQAHRLTVAPREARKKEAQAGDGVAR